MNIKSLFLSALVYFLVSLIFAFVLAIPDEMFFEEMYSTAVPLWRGELNESPQLLAAWFVHKMIFALGVAALFQWVFPTLKGPGWRRGIIFGLSICPLIWATYLGMWTFFALPAILWFWWGFYFLAISVFAGAAMGISVEVFTSPITKGIQSAER